MRTKLPFYISLPVTLAVGMILGVMLQAYGDLSGTFRELWNNRYGPSFFQNEPPPPDIIPPQFQGKLALFILAGQSNIGGRGEVPDGQQTNANVFVFGNDYRWKVAQEPVDDPTNQVDQVSLDPDAGFSPALAFATSLLERQPELAIGLIPCARGGSSMVQWQRSLSDHTLYGSCLKRVRAASVMGHVAGVLFFQGEAEAIAPELYQETALFPYEWRDRFELLVNNWRADLASPQLPVIFAQIGNHAAPDIFVNWELVKEQQTLVQMPYCEMITTDDLALKDMIHFTPESYQIIGSRFAEAYLNLSQE
ncbi:MAG: sialate O-acetylesterase [Anaerolineae bacterium]|nr:sialate O-acetylesterase [Anaerolineae bacterium]